MNILIYFLILSFSYDLPLIPLYSKWATVKASDIVGILFIFTWLLTFVFRPEKIKKFLSKQLLWYLIICAVTSMPTIIFMTNMYEGTMAFEYSGYWILKLLEYILFYFAIYKYSTERQNAYKFLIVFWIGGIGVSLYGLLQKYGFAPQLWGADVLTPNAITSTLSFHHGHLGAYMLMIFFLTLGLFLKVQKKKFKIVIGLSLILFLYIELLALRRSTWIGFSFGFILWIMLMQGGLNRKIKSYIVGVLIFISVVVSMIYSEDTLDRANIFYSTFYGNANSEINITSPVDVRLTVASFFINILKENPFGLLWGFGFMSAPMRYEFTGAHNQFLDVLHDSGIIGLTIFIWLIYSILKTLWQHSRLKDEWQPVYYSMFFGTVSLIVSGLTGGFFTMSHAFGSFVGFYLSLLSVIFASTFQLHNKSEIDKTNIKYVISRP